MESYQRLERELAAWSRLDPSGMVACSSGTAALHLALESFGFSEGTEVIVPDFCMVAIPRAVKLAGLVPVLVDCEFATLNMNPDLVHKAVSPLTKAAIVVHTYGRQAAMNRIDKAMYEAGPVRIVEDLAEAHGVAPHRGTDAACWSFYKNKIVHGEEGGAVWFRDRSYAARARRLRSLGFTDAHDFYHVPRGHNYRMANVLATLVRCSLASSAYHYARRQIIAAAYDAACPSEWRMPRRDALWVYDLRIPGMSYDTQDAVIAALRASGVEARHAFKPLHHQTEFGGCRRVGGERAEAASREVIYLPIRPLEKDEERAADVFKVIRRTLG